MIRDVNVPKWGLTIEEVTIVAWHVGLGDIVEQGQPLCEVETEKANADVEAPVSGRVVALLAKPGDDCSVGQAIAHLETDGAATAAATLR